MTNEQIRKIIEDSYDESKEETLRAMAGDFYGRRMRPTAILVYVWALIFVALAVYSAMQFFRADQTQGQIMYAALFIIGAHGVGLMKIFAWEMILRHSIRRDLKQLELRLAEWSKMLKSKQ
jgi:Family of unknown function (DUF6768)